MNVGYIKAPTAAPNNKKCLIFLIQFFFLRLILMIMTLIRNLNKAKKLVTLIDLKSIFRIF